MSEYAWFKLLVRAIGIILMALSVPMLIWWAAQMLVSLRGLNPATSSNALERNFVQWLPSMLAYFCQAGAGAYLFFGGEALIRRVISEVDGRCAKCGFELGDLKRDACPECNSPLRPTDSASGA